MVTRMNTDLGGLARILLIRCRMENKKSVLIRLNPCYHPISLIPYILKALTKRHWIYRYVIKLSR